jgi:hypothetical protein
MRRVTKRIMQMAKHSSELRGPQEVQPGTGQKGKSWHSDRPDPDDPEDKLEKALEDSFPASDPPAPAQPMATGWEVLEEEKKKQK